MEQEQEEEICLKRFLKWATELGITDSGATNPSPVEPISCLGHSLCVSHFPDAGGRGLGAARDLIKGELILRVPKNALMTSESLLRCDHSLSLALTNHPSLSSTQILGVCLLAEVGKGKNSWWYPYMMQLPRSYDTLAAFGSFERRALQVDYAIWAAEKATCKAECEWKEATPLMKELNLKPHLLSFKAWLWASSTISSRTMHVPWDEAGCLCPIGDFFNYAAPGEDICQYGAPCSQRHTSSSPEECSLWDGDATGKLEEDDAHMQRLTDGCYDEALGSYCFYARRNYKKGEQVLLSYGTYINLELLEHYGFLLHQNPNDKTFIPLEPGITSLSSWCKEFLYIQQYGKPSFALLSALRLWATHPARRKSVGRLVYSGSQLSAENEISVLQQVLNNSSGTLQNLPSTMEEDSMLLAAVDKIQDLCTPEEFEKLSSSFGDELWAFFEGKDKVSAEFLFSRKTRKAIDRLKLAVLWRLTYKRTLSECISYCADIVNSLSSHRNINQ